MARSNAYSSCLWQKSQRIPWSRVRPRVLSRGELGGRGSFIIHSTSSTQHLQQLYFLSTHTAEDSNVYSNSDMSQTSAIKTPGTGPTRTESFHPRLSVLYKLIQAREFEHVDAKAGQLAFPSGTGDAKNDQQNTEDEASASNLYDSHIPRVSGLLFDVRVQNGLGYPKDEVELESTANGSGRMPPNWPK
jgi:hypothetical protein